MSVCHQEDDHLIKDISGLEASIGRKSASLDLKVIDHLDEHALLWIQVARLAFVACCANLVSSSNEDSGTTGDGSQKNSIGTTLVLASKVSASTHQLKVPLDAIDQPQIVTDAILGAVFGSLWLLPGLGETLCINGKVVEVNQDHAIVKVEECYGHCAKALIRSDFWKAEELEQAQQPNDEKDASDVTDSATGDPNNTERNKNAKVNTWNDPLLKHIVATSRFMTIATTNGSDSADVSPKGDPEGFMTQFIDGMLCFAERPGNRRADSLRNILVQPHVELTLVTPGSNRVATIHGTVSISVDLSLRERFAVQGKIPKLVTCVNSSGMQVDIRSSDALANSKIWRVLGARQEERRPALVGVNAGKLFSAHIRRNKTPGVEATLTRTMVAMPGLVQKSLNQDYKDNLY